MALDILLRVVKEKVMYPFARVMGKFLSPNQITLFAFFFGLNSCYYAAYPHDSGYNFALYFWILNRVLDGIDGTVARIFHSATDFGGYLDIITDFIIYGLLPICQVVGNQSHQGPTDTIYDLILCSIMLALFFVNSASLFFLSSVLEKQGQGAKKTNQLTTVSMPPALIEGTETVIFFCLTLYFPEHLRLCFSIFAGGVAINIGQRLIWAYSNL